MSESRKSRQQPERRSPSPAEIAQNSFIAESDFDPEYSRQMCENIMEPLDDTYFRSKFVGFDHMPERNNPEVPLIYASNHSGMSFPWDAIVFLSGLLRIHDYDFSKVPRPLTSPMLSASAFMCPFLLRNFWKRAGGIDASFLNFETMMNQKDMEVMIFPEGVPGIGKGWNRRYQLQRFSTSFIRQSIKYKTDIIPFSTVNGEMTNPFSWKSDWLNKVVQKVGIPYMPVAVQSLLLPLQPWAFYYALPAKFTYVMGKRISPYQWIDKPYDEITEDEFAKIAKRVRELMQAELEESVRQHGKRPFDMKEFWPAFFRGWRFFPYNTPLGWPMIFREFERQYEKNGKVEKIYTRLFSYLWMMIRNPLTIWFFVPIIGWIPILLKAMVQQKKILREMKRQKDEREKARQNNA